MNYIIFIISLLCILLFNTTGETELNQALDVQQPCIILTPMSSYSYNDDSNTIDNGFTVSKTPFLGKNVRLLRSSGDISAFKENVSRDNNLRKNVFHESYFLGTKDSQVWSS